MKTKPTSQRVYRQLTPQERKRLDDARTGTNEASEKIIAEGRLRKEAWEANVREIQIQSNQRANF